MSALSDRLRGGSVIPYLTGGFPSMEAFAEHLAALAPLSEAVEVGLPFSDPMADGPAIQESSRQALEAGFTLDGLLAALDGIDLGSTPLVAMTYVNPVLTYGPERLFAALAKRGFAGVVMPDLAFEEGAALRGAALANGIAPVQLVTPMTPPDRLTKLAGASHGFTYAVTMAGTTGGSIEGADLAEYLGRVREASDAPVVAGFGIRSRDDVVRVLEHADGVIVGSALVDAIGRGEDPVTFVKGLRP